MARSLVLSLALLAAGWGASKACKVARDKISARGLKSSEFSCDSASTSDFCRADYRACLLVGQYQVPVGSVSQIRIFSSGVTSSARERAKPSRHATGTLVQKKPLLPNRDLEMEVVSVLHVVVRCQDHGEQPRRDQLA